MARIYCDTNIFSQLESWILPEFQELKELLDRHKSNLKFVFSPAHIRDKRVNKGKYKAEEGELDFNEAFKDGMFKKTFLAYVKDSLHHPDKTSIPDYELHTHAYSCLDMLGISTEDISKRNGYSNLFNDSLHSYYSRYCDYLVTEDKGLRKKSQALYGLFGVRTKIMNVKEFLEILPRIGGSTEQDISELISNLRQDLSAGNLIRVNDEITMIEPLQRYFNFFDSIIVLKMPAGEKLLFLTKRDFHDLTQPNYREQQAIVDRCVDLFGPDLNSTVYFDFRKEVRLIESNSWPGRCWEIDSIRFYLHHNEHTGDFCMQIGPFT